MQTTSGTRAARLAYRLQDVFHCRLPVAGCRLARLCGGGGRGRLLRRSCRGHAAPLRLPLFAVCARSRCYGVVAPRRPRRWAELRQGPPHPIECASQPGPASCSGRHLHAGTGATNETGIHLPGSSGTGGHLVVVVEVAGSGWNRCAQRRHRCLAHGGRSLGAHTRWISTVAALQPKDLV